MSSDPKEPGDPTRHAAEFTSLYRATAPAVYVWASMHLHPDMRSELDPEDLLQEVACRAFVRFPSFDREQGNFRAWVFGIARKVLYQSLEKMSGSGAGARRNWLTTGGLTQIPQDATSVTKQITRDEQMEVFMKFVEQLPDQDREMLLYRGLEGLGHGEVAALMSLEHAAAAKRWVRLRARLQESAVALNFLMD